MFTNSQYQSFSIENQLKVVEGNGGIPFIEVDNEFATALISIYGAQVLSFKKKSIIENRELLFVSENAYFEDGKAIKGGIPICWPWFGQDQEKVGKHMHGFARNLSWQLDETKTLDNGATQIILSLTDSAETLKLWPHKFNLTLTIKVGKTLELSLKTKNTGKAPFVVTQALHAYFAVSDINKINISGLDQINYLDKVVGATNTEVQQNDLIIDQEVDRIYLSVPDQISLIDKASEKEVIIESRGSKTAIVWNPWVDISKQSGDLTDNAYKHFVCIETANAVDDKVIIRPNGSHTLEAKYSLSKS